MFAPAVSYFGQLFNSGSRGGAGLAVRLHGRPVVDVWAGFADRRRSRPWERDTVTICFSTTKGVAATVIHRLADRGLVDYDAPVASYWPDFGAAGKQAITVRQLLSHQAGLHSMTDLVDGPEALLDHIALEERLAARPSDPWPGHPGYHAITFGWLLAGLARRVTGLGMADLVRAELAEPLGTDGLCIGMPPDGVGRFAPSLGRTPPVRPTPPLFASMSARSMPTLRKVELTRRFLEALYVPYLDRLLTGPSPSVLNTEMPSVNGLFSAHALAKLYAVIANDGEVEGIRLLSPETVRALSEVQTRAHDAVIGMRMNWRMGYHRAGARGYRGDSAFGHYGFGGSGGWADPATGLSFGFVTNELRLIQAPVGGDQRIFRLAGLVLRSARALHGGRRTR
ncbi:MAG TPA: serine hydrolase domain-containing protein [Acidimicrobiales bacterium]|nr:serine hydrolase domain-containing protein [Acidimicrobiales bacterium]